MPKATIFLELLCALSVSPADPAAAQVTHPFSYEELVRVFVRVAPEPVAREMARGALTPPEHPPARSGASGLAFRAVPHVDLTEDTLVLLALLSDTTAEKVRQYRKDLRGGRLETPEEAEAWAERYRRLKSWADTGYRVEHD